TMKNTGDEPLTMYLVAEPTPEGFRPNDYIYVNSETETQTFISNSHWINVWEHLIKPEDGLAQLQLVLSVWLYPNTFAQPHSHNETTEEVWCTLEGDVKFLLGKQIRDLPFGMAHMIPPDNKTPHANFNITDKPIKFFYFARFSDQEPRK
ncbi:cupin domain-containing protein, partial [Candidatus Latescibacterota bacterium]